MVAQHFRWDFVGLSTDTKPTPETSEKVVDGSTFYCSDTSKLYVFCKDDWYERKPLGGGGGTTYTAGDGITIANDEISVDLAQATGSSTTKVMSQKAVTDALASAGGSTTVLTTADYNWNSTAKDSVTTPFDCFAVWLLPSGMYKMGDEYIIETPSSSYKYNTSPYNNSSFIVFRDEESSGGQAGYTATLIFHSTSQATSLGEMIYSDTGMLQTGNFSNGALLKSSDIINNLTSTEWKRCLSAAQGKVLKDLIDSLVIKNAGAPTTSTVGTVGQLLEDTTNGKLYQCTAVSGNTYTWSEVGAGGGGGGATIPKFYLDGSVVKVDVASGSAYTSLYKDSNLTTPATVLEVYNALIDNTGLLIVKSPTGESEDYVLQITSARIPTNMQDWEDEYVYFEFWAGSRGMYPINGMHLPLVYVLAEQGPVGSTFLVKTYEENHSNV